MKSAFPDFAVWTAGERLQEVKDVGATGLVTACPFCEQNLGEAIDKMSDGMKLYDLTQLMVRALGIG